MDGKYGTFDWTNIKGGNMPKSKEQEMLELKEKIKQLERKNTMMEYELEMKATSDLRPDDRHLREKYKSRHLKKCYLDSRRIQASERIAQSHHLRVVLE